MVITISNIILNFLFIKILLFIDLLLYADNIYNKKQLIKLLFFIIISPFIEYNYLIYEVPNFVKLDNVKDHPDTAKPHLDSPDVEEPTQINNNIINTKKQIDKDDKTKLSSFFVAEEHNGLTLELIDSGYINENDIQIFYYDELFNKLLEENNSYNDLIQIVHYIVPRVKERNFKDEDGNIIKNKFGYFKNAIISNIKKLNLNIEDLWKEEDLSDFDVPDDLER